MVREAAGERGGGMGGQDELRQGVWRVMEAALTCWWLAATGVLQQVRGEMGARDEVGNGHWMSAG